MNRLKLLLASVVIASVSGCSLSVRHRDHEGCGEFGIYTSEHTCRNCGRKARRFARTAPLYRGDSYGQWGDPVSCDCSNQFMGSVPLEIQGPWGSEPYFGSSGCSSCGGSGFDGMISGGCASQGGPIDPGYLIPPAVPPSPVGTPSLQKAREIPAPVPPAYDPAPQSIEPSPVDTPSEQKQPMPDPVPEPFDSPKTDGFGTEPNGAPPAETPADPVSWQIPQ